MRLYLDPTLLLSVSGSKRGKLTFSLWYSSSWGKKCFAPIDSSSLPTPLTNSDKDKEKWYVIYFSRRPLTRLQVKRRREWALLLYSTTSFPAYHSGLVDLDTTSRFGAHHSGLMALLCPRMAFQPFYDESILELYFESILPFDLQADLTLLNYLELRKSFLPVEHRGLTPLKQMGCERGVSERS